MRTAFILFLLAIAIWQGYRYYERHEAEAAIREQPQQVMEITWSKDQKPGSRQSTTPINDILPAPASRFRCDGRTYCSQMTSCEEARFFLQNCPNVKMDGNNDGVPCEKQWCGRR